jgi:hypothetical protein
VNSVSASRQDKNSFFIYLFIEEEILFSLLKSSAFTASGNA